MEFYGGYGQHPTDGRHPEGLINCANRWSNLWSSPIAYLGYFLLPHGSRSHWLNLAKARVCRDDCGCSDGHRPCLFFSFTVLNKALVSRPCSKSRTTNEPEPLRCLYDSSSIRVRFLVDDFTHRFSIARRVSYSSSPPILSHSSGPSQIPSQFLDPVHPSSIYR